MRITIDPNSKSPIYIQIVDFVIAQVEAGRLAYNTKLPTVRQLAKQLDLAAGTISKAYEELEKRGYIELKQGKGTYVCYRRESSDSRKERAMCAIDRLLDTLEELSFSPNEMSIFIELKLRERIYRESAPQIALLCDCDEIVEPITRQLYELGDVDVHQYCFYAMTTASLRICESADIAVVCIGSSVATTMQCLNVANTIRRCSSPSTETLWNIAKLSRDERVILITKCGDFLHMMQDCLRETVPEVAYTTHCTDTSRDIDRSYIPDVVIVPQSYRTLLPEGTVEFIDSLPPETKRIEFSAHADRGSFMYLEEAVNAVRQTCRLTHKG